MSDFAHPFDAAIALTAATPNRRLGRTSADYWNMVSPYGGITAAAMMQAMLDHPDRRGTPLAFTINYLAPIEAGDYAIETELVRANRSSQHWAVRLLQGEPERVLAQVIAICAVRRETWSHVEATCPEVPPADACPIAPPRNATGFLQRYEFRIVRGKPFAVNEDSLSHVWVSDIPPRPLDFASLTAACWPRRSPSAPSAAKPGAWSKPPRPRCRRPTSASRRRIAAPANFSGAMNFASCAANLLR